MLICLKQTKVDMTNPYEIIDQRLSSIENVLIQLQKQHKITKPPSQNNGDALLTVDETAALMRTPKPTIYRKADQIGYIRHGKRILFRKGDILNFLEANRKKSRLELQDQVIDNLKRVMV